MKIKTLSIASVAIVLIPAVTLAKVEIAPYSSINFSEGLSMPSLGASLLSTNLSAELGTVVKPHEKHNFFGLYSLRYDGPGFKKQDGRQFTERSLDHIFILQHQYAINDRFSLKERLSYMKEFYRSGANEAFGQGLYDFNRTGLFVSFGVNGVPEIHSEFFEDVTAEASLSYDTLVFPNYTDLLKEFQISQGQATTESATGKQDQSVYQIGLTLKKQSIHVTLKDSIQSYIKQKVIGTNGAYGGTLQNDNVLSLEAQTRIKAIKNVVSFAPGFKFNLKTSNQNYLYFKTLSVSTQTFTFLGNYYDYNEYNLVTELDFYLTKNKTLFLIPEFNWKFYTVRPAMDANYNILPEKQSVFLTLYTLGYQVKWNEVSTFTLYYALQQQSSTMKFEKYVPYNYSGNYFGMTFGFSY
jgi:hypothetical protein